MFWMNCNSSNAGSAMQHQTFLTGHVIHQVVSEFESPLPIDFPIDFSRGVLKAMTSPFFPDLRRNLGPFLIDKTDLIENIVINNWTGDVDLVLRPRRCGKSTMLQMLNSFFSIRREGDPDPLQLFEGLRIASKKDICTEHMGKYPVIFCDFKNLSAFSWEGMLSNFKDLVSDLYMEWEDCLLQSLSPVDKTYFESICLKTATEDELTNSLYRLSKFLTRKFGRKVIVLIDEYEAPINCAFENDYFNEVRSLYLSL
ncbi:hypothetical protein F5888DRAFT_1643615 [Russula emetica]|nr:hypothetical protein F5888DRAFT_1643615 [Russula emetica]